MSQSNLQINQSDDHPVNQLFTTIGGLYRLSCYVLRVAALGYITHRLYLSLQVDVFGSLPAVGLWFSAVLFALMVYITRKTPLAALFFLSGLAGLVLIA